MQILNLLPDNTTSTKLLLYKIAVDGPPFTDLHNNKIVVYQFTSLLLTWPKALSTFIVVIAIQQEAEGASRKMCSWHGTPDLCVGSWHCATQHVVQNFASYARSARLGGAESYRSTTFRVVAHPATTGLEIYGIRFDPIHGDFVNITFQKPKIGCGY